MTTIKKDSPSAQVGSLRLNAAAEEENCSIARSGFSRQPLPKGNRFAVVVNAGGPGITAVDATIRDGLDPAKLSPTTIEALRWKLPPTASLFNPADIVGTPVSTVSAAG